MRILLIIGETLLIVSMVGFWAMIAWIAVSALALKNTAVSGAKRIYERPLASVKNLAATGKGIVLLETVRVKNIAGYTKTAYIHIRDTAVDVKAAADNVHFSDLQPLVSDLENIMKLLNAATKVVRDAKVRQAPVP